MNYTDYAEVTPEQMCRMYWELETKLFKDSLDESMPLPLKNSILACALRLVFHDCGGSSSHDSSVVSICDGCVSFSRSHDHDGLETGCIEALNAWWERDNYWCNIMSRADFWIAAATIGMEQASMIDYDNMLDYFEGAYLFGRETCDSFNGDAPLSTPVKVFPSAISDFKVSCGWFKTNFVGFTDQDCAAILGAHTVGTTHFIFSGFTVGSSLTSTGPWVNDNRAFNNGYYKDMVDRNAAGFDSLIWKSKFFNGKWFWTADPHPDTIDFYVMLNIDMNLWMNFTIAKRDLKSTGEVTCNFRCDGCANPLQGVCPETSTTGALVLVYAGSNTRWLSDFKEAFLKMITVSYTVTTYPPGDGEVYEMMPEFMFCNTTGYTPRPTAPTTAGPTMEPTIEPTMEPTSEPTASNKAGPTPKPDSYPDAAIMHDVCSLLSLFLLSAVCTFAAL
jgi:hypothetical protein